MKKKTNILFTSTFVTPFISTDIKFLQSFANLEIITSSGFFILIKYLFSISGNDITFSWFASVYSSYLVLLTKIFKKKSIIILGGVDVAKEKEYNYGIWNSWWRSKIVRYGIMHANIVLAVDESLKKEAIRLARYEGKNIFTVPTGYNSDQWFNDKGKEPFILSIGSAFNFSQIKKKGFDILFEIAAKMPKIHFVVIGISPEVLSKLVVPINVECIPQLPQSELLEFYQHAKVFAQLSRHEGMPNTLCEAMLCECVPVGSHVYGIPTAIGTTGYTVNIQNQEEIIATFYSALNSNIEMGKAARERISQLFSQRSRETALAHHIESLLQ